MARPGSGDHLLVTAPVGPSPEQITASKRGSHSERAAREHCDRRLGEQRQQGWQREEQVRFLHYLPPPTVLAGSERNEPVPPESAQGLGGASARMRIQRREPVIWCELLAERLVVLARYWPQGVGQPVGPDSLACAQHQQRRAQLRAG